MKKIVVFLAEGFEEMEAIVPIDLFKRAGIDVNLCSISNRKEVESAHGITVIADTLLEDESKYFDIDAVYFPGGMGGATNLSNSDKIGNLIKTRNSNKKLICAICASPALVLYPLGVLDGKKFTCYPSMEKGLTKAVHTSGKVVVDEHLITSLGPATSKDIAYTIIETLVGKQKADEVFTGTLFI